MTNLKNTVVKISDKHNIEAVEGLQKTPVGFVRTYLVNQVILEVEFTVNSDNSVVVVNDKSLLSSIHSLGYILSIFGANEGEVNTSDLTIDKNLNDLGLESMDTKTILDIYNFLNYTLLSLEV